MKTIENSPTLETERLILRKFQEDDLNAFLEIVSDENVTRYLPWNTITEAEEAMKFLESKFLQTYKNKEEYRYAICLRKDNKPIGFIGIFHWEDCSFGYGLKSPYWNQGIATEAAHRFVEKIRANGYSFLTAIFDVNNPASGKIMEHIGMKYKYSFITKGEAILFRLYQINFNEKDDNVYMGYWENAEKAYIEKNNANHHTMNCADVSS